MFITWCVVTVLMTLLLVRLEYHARQRRLGRRKYTRLGKTKYLPERKVTRRWKDYL